MMSILTHISQRCSIGLMGESVQQCSARFVHHHMERDNWKRYLGVSRSNTAKANRNTHINEKKFSQLRGRKNIPIRLPDYVEERKMKQLPPHELRRLFIERGLNMARDSGRREWNETQLTMNSFHSVMDSYLTPEDRTPFSFSDSKERIKGKFYTYWHGLRKIRKKEGFQKFKPKEFGPVAEAIYADAVDALVKRDKKALHDLVAEHAFGKLWPEVENRNLVWEILEYKSPSVVMAIRCGDFPYSSGNDIAQITVKMHSLQKYVIYDRFGRLLLGSSDVPKEVTEYIVFENHISSTEGRWRVLDKVYPNWVKPKEPVVRPDLYKTLSDNERPSSSKKVELGFDEHVKREKEKQKKMGAK